MGNPNLLPYETIVRATSGEPEAVDEVLRHYSKRIRPVRQSAGQGTAKFFTFLLLLYLTWANQLRNYFRPRYLCTFPL